MVPPFIERIYKISGRLLVSEDKTELVCEAGVTVRGNPWMHPGSQTPFGSLFLVTGKYCSIIGAGMGQTRFEITGGSQANGVTFLHTDGGYAGYLTIDGGKSTTVVIEDDTFMTGVSALNATGGNPSGTPSVVTFEEIELVNFAQYGGQAYGDLAEVNFIRCNVHDNGVLSNPLSRGSGLALTRGNRNCSIDGCRIRNNKENGIFMTAAGLDQFRISITNNKISLNGRFGLSLTAEADHVAEWGSAGTNAVTSTGNEYTENGGGDYSTTGGIRLGTFDGVGHIIGFSTSGDLIQDNIGYGMIVFTNDDPVNRTSRVSIDSVITGNSIAGLGLGSKIDDTIRYNATKIRGNPVKDIENSGDSRLVSNARGQGTSVASASTITLPLDGDIFVVTGSATINNITPDPGRTVIFVLAGGITFSNTGNLAMQNNFVGAGNATISFVCIGGSWFEIARKLNA